MTPKKLGVFIVLALTLPLVLIACSKEIPRDIEDFAKTYTENLMKGEWNQVANQSTGEQLSVFLLLKDQLEQTSFTADVRLVEVLDVSGDEAKATALVHVVRDMDVEGYGRLTDNRQLLLSLYNMNNEWKVYRVDVVFEE